MSEKIGHFDILSELARTDHSVIYKASDPESGQIIALKAMPLDPERDQELIQAVLREAEGTKYLNHQSIALIYGVGEIGGQFCAAMEYVQGNSIATMIARREGFSIWDLLDISRQTCQAFDHAHTHSMFHYSLEPAKVMVQWDGLVKILGFGVSRMGLPALSTQDSVPPISHYMSPEQVRGEPLDARSNLFSWGAILYEMVTEHKPFEAETADGVRARIVEEMPPPPRQLSPKVSGAMSDLIMKTLAKAPEERYQSGQELLQDLEKCKESVSSVKKSGAPAKGLNLPTASNQGATAQVPARSGGAAQATATRTPAKAVPRETAPAAATAKPTAAAAAAYPQEAPLRADKMDPKFSTEPVEDPVGTDLFAARPSHPVEPGRLEPTHGTAEFDLTPAGSGFPENARAAAAGASQASNGAGHELEAPRVPQVDSRAQFIASSSKAIIDPPTLNEAHLLAGSDAVAEPEAPPAIKVDPLMTAGAAVATGPSFSELDELPPLKEAYEPPAPPPPAAPEPAAIGPKILYEEPGPEKPKIQPKEVAKKAVRQIRQTPPKLYAYSISAAAVVILIALVWITFRIHSDNSDEDSTPAPSTTNGTQPQAAPAQAPTHSPQSSETPASAPAPEVKPEPVVKEQAAARNRSKGKNKAPVSEPLTPVVIPGQLTINSTPEGAQVQLDGRSDPTWVTPYNITGLAPGAHSVSVTKAGFASDTRSVEIASGSKSFLTVALSSLNGTLSVASEPTGASVIVDGKDTKLTPAQVTLEKGSHMILVRKTGYLDETTSINLQAGQSFHYAPTLRQLGTTDEIKTSSKLKKLFGGKDASAGMGAVSIRTTPKGAQIAVNRRMLDKASPVEFYVNPGNYVVDITMPGYKSIQRIINVDKDGRVALDETLERE
jgi:serine/threonine-protein kinase